MSIARGSLLCQLSDGERCFSRFDESLSCSLWPRFADLSLLPKSIGRWVCTDSFRVGEGVLLLGPGSISGKDEKEGGRENEEADMVQ